MASSSRKKGMMDTLRVVDFIMYGYIFRSKHVRSNPIFKKAVNHIASKSWKYLRVLTIGTTAFNIARRFVKL